MRPRTIGLMLALAAGAAGCGSSSSTPGGASTGTASSVTASQLAASMKSALIARSGADVSAARLLGVSCSGGTLHTGQTVRCSALATAGRGYSVQLKLPCWTASFNGTIIEGPGLVAPPRRPNGSKRPVTTTPAGPTPKPTNLPDSFSGCVK